MRQAVRHSRIIRLACAWIVGALAGACASDDSRAPYTDGHADILVELVESGGSPRLEAVLFAGGATIDGQFLTSGAVSLDDLVIRSKARFSRPTDDGGAFAPVCASEGSEISWLPQSLRDANESESPFLGLAASFEPSQVDQGALRLALVSVDSPSGQGHYSLWQDGFPPRFFMSSCDGIDGIDGQQDGPAGSDMMELVPGHDHYNMGFSEPGEWTVQYRASAFPTGAAEPIQTDFEVRYVLE